MELQPLKITTNKKTDIFFHNKIDDQLYIFKSPFKQSKLRMFGTFRTLRVDESDLIKMDTLTNMKAKNELFIIQYLRPPLTPPPRSPFPPSPSPPPTPKIDK